MWIAHEQLRGWKKKISKCIDNNWTLLNELKLVGQMKVS